MSNAIKKYNRFVETFNKTVEESKKPHPSEDTIHLYAMKALPQERMEQLKEHLEYCPTCGELLAEAEEFQQIAHDVDAGILGVDVEIPDLKELKERTFGKEGPSNWLPLAEILLDKVRNLILGEQGGPGFVPAATFADGDLERIEYNLGDGSKDEIEVYQDPEHKRIEIYSANEELVGKTIKIYIGDDRMIEFVFNFRPAALKRKPVKAMGRFENLQLSDIKNDDNVRIEIQ